LATVIGRLTFHTDVMHATTSSTAKSPGCGNVRGNDHISHAAPIATTIET
jgi:hypothetical protein